MAKKNTTKKMSKKPSRESKINRGARIGRTVRSVQMRLPADLIEWMDDQAKASGMSRTQWTAMVLEGARKFGGAAESSGLFDDMENQIESAVRRALDSVPTPDLQKLLASKARKRT
jgi:hypothetical protein